MGVSTGGTMKGVEFTGAWQGKSCLRDPGSMHEATLAAQTLEAQPRSSRRFAFFLRVILWLNMSLYVYSLTYGAVTLCTLQFKVSLQSVMT